MVNIFIIIEFKSFNFNFIGKNHDNYLFISKNIKQIHAQRTKVITLKQRFYIIHGNEIKLTKLY